MTEFESASFIILIRVSLCWTNLVAAALELELDLKFGQRTIPTRHKTKDWKRLSKCSDWLASIWLATSMSNQNWFGNSPELLLKYCWEIPKQLGVQLYQKSLLLAQMTLQKVLSRVKMTNKNVVFEQPIKKPCLNLFQPMHWERKSSSFQHSLLSPSSKDSIQHRHRIVRSENVGWCRREAQLFEQPIAELHFLHLNFDWFIPLDSDISLDGQWKACILKNITFSRPQYHSEIYFGVIFEL